MNFMQAYLRQITAGGKSPAVVVIYASSGWESLLLPDQSLLLVGHGSSRYPDAGRALYRHADTLRATGRFAQVAVAMLNGDTTPAQAIAHLGGGTIRIVPCFMEDGYFTRVAVPRALRADAAAVARLIVCPPIGVHPGIAAIAASLAADTCAQHGVDPSAAAVVLVGHGSARAPGRTLALHAHAARLAETGRFAQVLTACLEEPPFVPEQLARMRTSPTVVIGCFASNGSHARADLPGFIAAEAAHRAGAAPPVLPTRPMSEDPALATIILDQAASAHAAS